MKPLLFIIIGLLIVFFLARMVSGMFDSAGGFSL